MRVLWLVGIIIPQASKLIGHSKIPFGGWVSNMIAQLANRSEFEIGVAMRANVSEFMIKKDNNLTFYYLPQKGNNSFDIYPEDCQRVIEDFQPDLVHCEGTEFQYTNTFLKVWKGPNVVSLQGVINGYEPYEYGEINPYELISIKSLKDSIMAFLMILNKKIVFKKRIQIEADTIARAQNILGRTIWDRANSYFFNRKAPYFVCRRILRTKFYESSWNESGFVPHQIFIGNFAQARKGAHFVLEAIALLKVEYPDIKIVVAGGKFESNLRDWKTYFGYRSYLMRKIKRMKLEKHVEFLGLLQQEQMIDAMCNSNVFVMASVIENSPNTLGEAMILGVPSVASYNGGVSEMARDEQEALLYRSNDPRMLAFQIKRIFDDMQLARRLSDAAKVRAKLLHDPVENLNDLLFCYKTILHDKY